jgi:hypothetical protein
MKNVTKTFAALALIAAVATPTFAASLESQSFDSIVEQVLHGAYPDMPGS